MALYSILSGIDPRLTWPGILVVILMLPAAVAACLLSPGAWVRSATRVIVIALGMLAALQIMLACSYFFYPRYIDWIEPMVVAASWIGWHGGHFYPALSGGDVMGNWYGPFLYQLYGFFLWLFGPSIGSSKILGIAAFVGEQFLLLWMLKRVGASRGVALSLTFVQCLLQAGFNNQGIAFGARADALLLLTALLGVITATSATNVVNAAILGVLMGAAANLKIHGVFYIVPSFFVFISPADNNVRRLQLTAAAGAAALVDLALPFAMESASLARYIDLFGLTKHHGFSKWILEKNIAFLAMLWSPLVLLYALFVPKLPRVLVWFFAGCVPSMAVVAVAGAVQGSGPYNLLSFIPLQAWAVVVLLRAIDARGATVANRLAVAQLGMAGAFLVGFAPLAALSSNGVLREYSDAPYVRQALAVIDEEMKNHPGRTFEVGPGPLHDLRVIPVFRGNPLPIDNESWADLNAGGVDKSILSKAIANCRVDYWLMPPGGAIFIDAYQADLFPADFRADFRRHYRIEQAGPVFDRWRCISKN